MNILVDLCVGKKGLIIIALPQTRLTISKSSGMHNRNERLGTRLSIRILQTYSIIFYFYYVIVYEDERRRSH